MLEMQGFNRQRAEADWQRKLDSGQVKTALDLFLLGYDIMRMHHSLLTVSVTQKHRLALGKDDDMALLYENFPKSYSDNLYIWADRGYAKEVIVLPRDYSAVPDYIVEPQVVLEDYNSLWFQRRLTQTEELEQYIDPTEDDVRNTASTIWRGHLKTNP